MNIPIKYKVTSNGLPSYHTAILEVRAAVSRLFHRMTTYKDSHKLKYQCLHYVSYM